MPSMVAGSAARLLTVWTLEPKLSLWARHAENPNMAGGSPLPCIIIHHIICSWMPRRGLRYTLLVISFRRPASTHLWWVLWNLCAPQW